MSEMQKHNKCNKLEVFLKAMESLDGTNTSLTLPPPPHEESERDMPSTLPTLHHTIRPPQWRLHG
jgi:hypothetical protein